MRSTKGFSLIELLIVVAIILIIAAIAIPNLLQARMSANEASAVGSHGAIKSAEITYTTAYPTVGFTPTTRALGGATPCTPSSTTACLLDSFLSASTPGSGGKSGYVFLATGIMTAGAINNTAFVAAAAPVLVTFHREPRLTAPPTMAFCVHKWRNRRRYSSQQLWRACLAFPRGAVNGLRISSQVENHACGFGWFRFFSSLRPQVGPARPRSDPRNRRRRCPPRSGASNIFEIFFRKSD